MLAGVIRVTGHVSPAGSPGLIHMVMAEWFPGTASKCKHVSSLMFVIVSFSIASHLAKPGIRVKGIAQ